jgi:hypothetical protein
VHANGPIRISTNCETCFQPVELQFAWTNDSTSTEPAVWLCPHCFAKQRIQAVGDVLRADKAAPKVYGE